MPEEIPGGRRGPAPVPGIATIEDYLTEDCLPPPCLDRHVRRLSATAGDDE